MASAQLVGVDSVAFDESEQRSQAATARTLGHQSSHQRAIRLTTPSGHKQPPLSTAAHDRFAQRDVAERTIELATSESRRSSRPSARRTIAFAPAALGRHRRARLRNATRSAVSPRAAGRLHRPDDAQAEPRELTAARTAAFIGHETAGSPRKDSPGRRRVAQPHADKALAALWAPDDGAHDRLSEKHAAPACRANVRAEGGPAVTWSWQHPSGEAWRCCTSRLPVAWSRSSHPVDGRLVRCP